MNKFRNVPAVITLLAGFVVSVIMIMNKFSLVNFLWVLVCVMAGFYVAGVIVRRILNKTFEALNKEEQSEDSDESDESGEDGEGEKSLEDTAE